MAKVVIFGVRDLASLAHFYLKPDSKHEVVASVSKSTCLRRGLLKVFRSLPLVCIIVRRNKVVSNG